MEPREQSARVRRLRLTSLTSFPYFFRAGVIAASMNHLRIRPSVQLYFDSSEPAVAHTIGRRVGDQVLAAHFVFYLFECFDQVVGAAGKIRPPSGFIAHPPKHVFSYTLESEPIADPYRIDHHARSPRPVDSLVELAAARVIDTIGQQDHRAAGDGVIARTSAHSVGREDFISGNVDGVVQCCCLSSYRGRTKTPRELNLVE